MSLPTAAGGTPSGPGAISLDAALGLALAEPLRLALAVLALLGALTALAIARVRRRRAPRRKTADRIQRRRACSKQECDEHMLDMDPRLTAVLSSVGERAKSA